jgi:hypothetical protein
MIYRRRLGWHTKEGLFRRGWLLKRLNPITLSEVVIH